MTSARNLFAICATWSLLVFSCAEASEELSDDIAAQPVAQALIEFAHQTGLQLAYESEIAATQVSKGAPRGLTARDALERLLEGTGLQFEFLNDRTVRVFAAPVAHPTKSSTATTTERQARRRANSWFALEEVVVTATRREEQVNDVPISIAVWTEDAMARSGIKGMSEIGALTPGVEFDQNTNITADLHTNLVIRGVTDRHGATTGVFIDDAPIPAGRAESFGRSFPWAFDLDRVEVLRGPQSTMLGGGTLGGAVRFIFHEPSLTTFSRLAHTEIASTARGDATYEVGAVAGGPMVPDALGFRVSGWYRSDGGYVDYVDPFTGGTVEENANRLLSESVRAALTWAPATSVRITPSLMYESFDQNESSAFYVDMSDPKSGVLKNANLVHQPAHDTFYLGTLDLTASLGRADLSSVTSYYDRRLSLTIDWSPEDPVDYGDSEAMPYELTQTMFSQEVRLTSDPDAALTWTAGAFYSEEHKRETTRIVDISGRVDSEVSTVIDQTQSEVFGQIELSLAPRFTASGGVRIGRSSYQGVTEIPPTTRAEAVDTAVTPRFDLTYRTDAGTLFYLTVAEGYRSGDIAPPLVTCGDSPTVVPADTLWSYEIGAKANFLDGRLHLEPSVFHMQWYNEQPDALWGDEGCVLGAARVTAVSNGFDLMAQALVTERLKIGLAAAYTHAYYTQTLTVDGEVVVRKGEALGLPPQVPSPWNVTASIDYHYPLSRDVTAELSAQDIFHSRNPGPFPDWLEAAGYLPDPSTNVLNLRAQVEWPSFDVSLFVNNVLDAQPFLGVRPGCAWCTVRYGTTFRPRTVGMSASWRF